MTSVEKFNLPDGQVMENLIDKISETYGIKTKSEPVESNFVIYDTFDWRLYGNLLMLYRADDKLHLRKLDSQKIITRTNVSGGPGFAWNLPPGKLKNTLTPIIQMRALLNLAEVTVCATTYPIVNKDKKTVARLVYEEARALPAAGTLPLAKTMQIQPVRGYTQEAKALLEILQAAGLNPDVQDTIYYQALAVRGKKPGDYSSKLTPSFAPDMRADEATRQILRQLLETIKINEPYVKQDIDTEFLHDFRVAIRRTRSAINQIHDVFSPELTTRHKQDFAYVGKISNKLRDLDVYLLSERQYKSMLPHILRPNIEPLFDYLREKRVEALQSVISELNSVEYNRIIEDWMLFLNHEPITDFSGPNGQRPIIDLARHRIYKRYRRVIKSGKLIIKNQEDKQLHSLRIECKKLRYLLEFFASLFPPDEITLLIKQLKILQNNLGDFNDLCVQEAYLIRVSAELPVTADSQRACLAIGSLIGTLDKKRRQVKRKFAQAFNAFAAPQNKRLFKTLFAAEKGEK